MKTSKRLIALLMAALLAFGLCACNSDSGSSGGDDDSIVGKWKTEIDMTDMLNEVMEDEAGIDTSSIKAKVKIGIYMKFTDDGEITMSVDTSAMADSVSDYLDEMVDPLVDAIYAAAKEEGMSSSELDSEFEDMYGMSVRKYCKNMISELDVEEMLLSELGDEEVEGYYKLKGTKLYVSDDEDDLDDLDDLQYMKVKISDGKLTLDEGNYSLDLLDDLVDMGISLPLVFKRA